MAINEIHKGDVGTIFTFTIYDETNTLLNIGSATTKNVIIKKPNNTTLTKSASFYTDGSDGKLSYTTVSGDLDLIGTYYLQCYISMPIGSFYSDINNIQVFNNL